MEGECENMSNPIFLEIDDDAALKDKKTLYVQM